MTTLIADTETDGLWPSRFHLIGLLDYDTDEFTAYTAANAAEGMLRMQQADILIGYNLVNYDIRHIERLTDNLVVFDRARLIDLLPLSRRLRPEMPDHRLETWGAILGYPKFFYDHRRLDLKKMVPYCERDCRLTAKVFEHLAPDI